MPTRKSSAQEYIDRRKEEKNLLDKVSLLKMAATKKPESMLDETATESPETVIAKLLEEIPRRELREIEERRIELYNKGGLDQQTIEALVRGDIELILMSYMDGRAYLRMPNREFIEFKLAHHIGEIIDRDIVKTEDLYSVARINFDMNGLKTLNDIGSHTSGNEGLSMFANVLKNGETVKWLEAQGIEVAASAEGGDEFGMVLHGPSDLRPILKEIEERFRQEIWNLDARKLIDFSDEKTKATLKKFRIPVADGFEYRISTSVGSATFGELLATTDLSGAKTYEAMINRVIKMMFGSADARAIKNKEEFKAGLKEINQTLAALYERETEEVRALKRLVERVIDIINLSDEEIPEDIKESKSDLIDFYSKKLLELVDSLRNDPEYKGLKDTVEKQAAIMETMRWEKAQMEQKVTKLEIELLSR